MLEIFLAAVEGEIELEKVIAQKLETVYPSSTSSMGVMFFARFLVTDEKGF